MALTGFGSLDSRTLQPRDRPVRVVYRIREGEKQQWLVREQTSLDVSSNQNVWTEIVSDAISGIQIVPRPAASPGDSGAVELILRSARPSEPEFHRWIVLQ